MIRSRIRARGGIIQWFLSSAYKADSVSPSLILDFANNRYAANSSAKNFSDILTFSRSTTATYFDANGVMQTAAADVPRFDCDPATGVAKGLLVEGARTNYIKNSELFNNWTVNTMATVSVNTDTAPDGNLTMDTVNMAASISSGVYRFDLASAVSTSYCFSMFVKHKSGGKKIKFGSDGSGSFGTSTAALAIFDTETLTFSSVGSAVTSYGHIDVGGGIYRIYVVATSTASASGNVTTPIFNGDGTGVASFAVWGYQLEIGSFPSSYIPTTSSAVTRAADVAMNTSSNTVKFADWYNQSEGAVYTNCSREYSVSSGEFPPVIQIDDNSDNNRITQYLSLSGTQFVKTYINTSGVAQANLGYSGSTDYTEDATLKISTAYKANDISFTKDGGSALTDSSATIPTVNRLKVGFGVGGASWWGHIKELRYYPVRVSNVELQRITT